jgi:hypothetical protein
LSVGPDGCRRQFLLRSRERPEPKKLKASPEGEALLTSEGEA